MVNIILLLLVGCAMGDKNNSSSQNGDFKHRALKIVEILELSIKHVGYPEGMKDYINSFYDSDFSSEAEEIKKKIMMLNIEFLGRVNFKDRGNPENKVLAEQLFEDINEIRNLIEELD